MKGEIRHKILKYILGICTVLIVLGFTTIDASANRCGGKSCGCGPGSCIGRECYGTYPSGCVGHKWYTREEVGNWHKVADPWCTTPGRNERTVTVKFGCNLCSKNGVVSSYTETSWINALGHAGWGGWRDEGGYHARYCTRCSGNRQTASHRYNYWDHYDVSGLHYSNCLDCGHYISETYSFTVYFNLNGGDRLVGDSARAMAGGSSTHSLNTTAIRAGYEFAGWSNSPVWSSKSSDRYSASERKQAYQWAAICGQSIQRGNSSGTLYAQWERTITYTFHYWDTETQKGAWVKSSVYWHNDDTADKTMVIPEYALGNKSRLGQEWIHDGFDLSAALNFKEEDVDKFTDVTCEIDEKVVEFPVNISGVNLTYYSKYHTTVTLTYVDYSTDKQETRTQSKTAYMNWDYTDHTEPSFVTFTQHIMKFTEASARCTHGFEKDNGDDNSVTGYTRCELCKQETWDSIGWAFENKESAANVNYGQEATVNATASGHNNVSSTLYGRYSKIVTLSYNYNGGTAMRAEDSYTRNANAFDVEAATTTSFVLPSPTYIVNDVTKYNLGAWTGTRVNADNDFNVSPSVAAETNIVGKNTTNNVNYGENFAFIPRVSDTIYASWTNQTDQTAIEPKVTVVKSVKWKTPTSDNSVVDYDNEQNIDINGHVVVTLDITVENKDNYQLTNFDINDYVNTDMWIYLGNVTQTSNVSGYNYTQSNGGIYFVLDDTSASSATYKVTYELQLKEDYWDVDKDTNLYVNKIADVNKYLNALTNKTDYLAYDDKNNYNSVNGLVDYSNMYYCEGKDEEKSFVIANYTIKNGSVRGTRRNVHYSTPYVVMRQVNWKPIVNSSSNKEVSQLTIQNGTNVYHNIDSDYKNTYFVQYDTKSTNSSNSTFNIYSNSSIRRSYDYYQITDNLLDIRTNDGKNQVIDNNIGLNASNSATIKDSTSSDANTTGGTALNISTGNNTHNTVTAVNNANYYTVQEITAKILVGGNAMPAWIGQKASEADFKKESETEINGKPAIIWTKKVYQDVQNKNVGDKNVEYPYGGLTSVSTLYATNQDGLEMNIYPYVRTTNSKLNQVFETTRDTSDLANQRLNITIDASDPIITADDLIKTESDVYGEWTDSDGYVDINLVNSGTNPTLQEHKLVFKFEDEVSGVNSPLATNEDWINTTSDNIYVTLKRVDNDEITIYDSEVDKTNADNSVVKITYDSSSTMNKTGSIQVVLNPENEDILGHLQLTIRVYDNVSNWTEKVYDFYVFNLTGAVEIADTLPDYVSRILELNRFANGEMGYVKVEAGGYVDRATVTFGEYLERLYNTEIATRKNFLSDTVTSINGDYPYDDAKNAGTVEDSSMTYLPYSMQVNTWGYTDDTLGGLKIAQVELEKYTSVVNNSIVQEHLNDLVERYQGMSQGAEYENEVGSDYAIVGSTLYTYPVVSGDDVTSYVDRYELGGETYYDNILYPAYITLDGTKGITIIYDSVKPDVEDADETDGDDLEGLEPDESEEDEDVEENELRRKIVASIEDETEIILSSWVPVGDGYLRPFVHYFYMPLEAEAKDASEPYYVTLTAYKDSEKDFKHSVSIRLSFYNDLDPIHKKLETYIKDN